MSTTKSSSVLTVASTQLRQLLSVLLTLDGAKSTLFYYVILVHALKVHRHLRARGVVTTGREIYSWISQRILHLILRLPSMQKRVASEMGKAKADIERKLLPQGPNVVRHLTLPQDGKSLEWILAEMDTMDDEMGGGDVWKTGKLSGAVYHGGDDLTQVITAAYSRYCVSNPLHPDAFPAVRKMEAEIVSMCLKIYNAPEGAAGAMTSGGTESIIMAVKAYRDWARKVKGITEPEMIIATSAHAAFDKGADYMGIKWHSIPVDPVTRQIDIKRVKRAINPNTILLVGSSINFPDGNQDDITALSALALRYNLGLHVDCCLGSFIMPFLEPTGLSEGVQVKEGRDKGKWRYKMRPFDFRVRGVTSVSCDTHKYGFAPKGTSVIMYRTAELRRFQYYVNPTWSGGVYASPSMSGSRPGALIAGCWAVMCYMGSEGYRKSAHTIVQAARTIADAIHDDIPELYVLGDPPASVVAFGSRHPRVDALEVGDGMSRRGWHLNALSNPKSVHIACTRLTVDRVDQFIADLKECVREVQLPDPAGEEGKKGKGNMVAVYGLGNSSAVGPDMVSELAAAFLDTLYKA